MCRGTGAEPCMICLGICEFIWALVMSTWRACFFGDLHPFRLLYSCFLSHDPLRSEGRVLLETSHVELSTPMSLIFYVMSGYGINMCSHLLKKKAFLVRDKKDSNLRVLVNITRIHFTITFFSYSVLFGFP